MSLKQHPTSDIRQPAFGIRHPFCILHSAFCIAALAAFAASAADVEFWSVPAFSSVRRLADTYPADGEKGGAVEYVVTPGEHTGGSFVLRADADIKGATLSSEGEFSGAMDPYVVKLWYQGGSAWYGYFADTASRKLVPELLLHDETLVEVDHRTKDNYVRYVNTDGIARMKWMSADFDIVDYTFDAQANLDLIRDADTLQPFALEKGRFKQIMVQFHVPATAKCGSAGSRGNTGFRGETRPARSASDSSCLPVPPARRFPPPCIALKV